MRQTPRNASKRNDSGVENSSDFKDRLAAIIDKPITPENINTYLDEAFSKMVNLSEDALTEYQRIHPEERIPTVMLDGKALPQKSVLEDKAFAHFGLQAVPEILDLIAKKQGEMEEVKRWMGENMREIRNVIVPPQTQSLPVGSGSGMYEKPATINHLQALLYVLKSVGIDLNDLTLTEGTVTPSMMRKMSYVGVEIQKLNRLVLVCDEAQNATYVLDLKKSLEKFSLQTLFEMRKEQINDALEHVRGLGVRLIHTSRWTERIRELLIEELTADNERDSVNGIPTVSTNELDPWRGFYQSGGNHFGSIRVIAKRLDISYEKIENLLQVQTLQHIKVRSGSRVWDAYSFEEIQTHLAHYLSLPQAAPEGDWRGFLEVRNDQTNKIEHWGSVKSITSRLGIPPQTIRDAIIESRLFPTDVRSITGQEIRTYPFERIALLFADTLALPKAIESGKWKGFYEKEGLHYGTIEALATKFDVHFDTMKKMIKNSNIARVRIRLRGKEADTYCYENIAEAQAAFFALPEIAKEGEWKGFHMQSGKHYGTISAIANRLRVSRDIIQERLKKVRRFGLLDQITIKDSIGRRMVAYAIEDLEPLIHGVETTQ